ncbi:MAG: hypothetical protein ACQET7_00770, partial [Thermodesulfobacteriota bacterium]
MSLCKIIRFLRIHQWLHKGGVGAGPRRGPGPQQASFHPEMVFFANLGVNLRGCLCGVLQYASAQ